MALARRKGKVMPKHVLEESRQLKGAVDAKISTFRDSGFFDRLYPRK